MLTFRKRGLINSFNCFVFPVWASMTEHPCESKLSFVYVRDIESGNLTIVNFNHFDSEPTDGVLLNAENAFIYDMKSLIFNSSFLDAVANVYDVNMVKYLQSNQPIEELDTTAHTFYMRKFNGLCDMNNYIPIVKHIELIDEIYKEFRKYYETMNKELVSSYSKYYIQSLAGIEKNGFAVKGGVEYTNYNPYTVTSRPSNAFNGVNYAALNKDDGTRKRFQSRFRGGKLIQFDYDAYHVRLIADLIGFDIPYGDSAHKELLKYYGDVDYDESKGITFRQLYGSIQAEYAHIPFFKKVDEYKDVIWEAFKADGFVETEMGRPIKNEHYRDFSKNKLFNYLLQATETERNLKRVYEINNFLKDYKSMLVLYTYDSFLFDIHPDEMYVLRDLKILIDENKFPTKMEMGKIYSKMESFKEDF